MNRIKDITGDYMLYVNNKNYDLSITGKGAKQTAAVKIGDKKITSKFSFKDDWVSITLNDDSNFTRMLGKIINASNVMQGDAFDTRGNKTSWSASKASDRKDPERRKY